MPSKFRLSVHRKKERKKAQKRSVTVQHLSVHFESPFTSFTSQPVQSTPQPIQSTSQVQPEEFKVSIPRAVLWSYDVVSVTMLQERIRALPALPCGWVDAGATDGPRLVLSKVLWVDGISQVRYSIEIASDFGWILSIGKETLQSNCGPLATLPQALTSVSNVLKAIEMLESLQFCTGNNDVSYFCLQAARKGRFMDSTGSKLTALYLKDHFSYPTIRCSSCQIVVRPPTSRCDACKEYRKSLNSMLSRHRKVNREESSKPGSHTNYRFLSTPLRRVRRARLRATSRVCQQRVKRLTEQLTRVIEERGIAVEEDLHEELVKTMEDTTADMKSKHPPGSFQRLFWEQQERAMQKKDSRSMRWEPAMIRWCLYLRHLSGAAYEVLRNTGVIHLPSQRTLRDYTYYTDSVVGFSLGVDKQLMDNAQIKTCADRDKYVIIILDEMHVRENLVYNKHSGSIVGFSNLGDLNSQLSDFEKSLDEGSEGQEPLANSMLVVMVRGLFSKFQFAYAQFPCSKLYGYQLYDIFWEAVERLERCGFRVIACTCDGLSVNRRFFSMHGPRTEFLHKVENPFSSDGRFLFFFSDPPHLIKTVRNCWSSQKRLLWNDGKYIQWSHLGDLYKNSRSNITTPGLTIVPKLKYEHLNLTSFSKMRVDLAAQALSNSVGEAMRFMKRPEMDRTVEFVLFFDKFFDCLNVSNLEAGRHSRNAFKFPYHSATDFRIKWLKEEFLGYLEKWEKSVKAREGFTPKQRNMMLLSDPTRLGLRLTDLVEYVFTIPGVTVFLSNRICQDPLENFFGQQRQRGRVNENPCVSEFLKNTQALRVINSTGVTVRGNCRGVAKRRLPFELDNTALPKRKKLPPP